MSPIPDFHLDSHLALTTVLVTMTGMLVVDAPPILAQCYKCQGEITSTNWSEEHIFPNSCGGRLKSKDLLCKSCNSSFGRKYDATFAEQVKPFMNLLCIERDRGEVQSVSCKGTVSGMEFSLLKDGEMELRAPVVNEMNSGGNLSIHVSCRSPKEMRRIIKGFHRKYPEIDVERELESVTNTRHHVGESLRFDLKIGGEDFFKAVAKIAINFFIYRGGKRKHIEQALQFFDNANDANIIAFYYRDKTVYTPSENEISHLIRVIGSPTEKTLYAYIELFNTLCFIVNLADDYEGEGIDETYVYDLRANEEIDKKFEFCLSKQQIQGSTSSRNITDSIGFHLEEHLTNFTSRIEKSQINNIIKMAINQTLGKLSEGEVIQEQHLKELIGKLQPLFEWIASQHSPR